VAQHEEIIAAIAAGDAEAAVKLDATHIRAAGEDMLTQMRQVRMSIARYAKQTEKAESTNLRVRAVY
jgi:DNA-binding FadR family transcriptional regulator